MTKLKNVLTTLKQPTKICIDCFDEKYERSLRTLFNKALSTCDKCFNVFSIKFYSFKVLGFSCLSLYDYDDEFRSKLYQLKGCYDIVIAKSFLETYARELSILYSGYIIVCAPSSKDDDMKRGFNHVIEIFKVLKLNLIENVFYKEIAYKQSDQKFDDRKNIEKVIKINKIDLKDKKILLVDDVITSGNTIKTCLNLLLNSGVKHIKILTLSVSKHYNLKRENMLKKALKKLMKINKVD